ncbi:hypothetical protein F5883DRAFT_212188 [Diaporthe sp. PMI_573]|nr:hypothetical protein F5883DRAFT_212188 [Diaporthaceae sp. PMI_573]
MEEDQLICDVCSGRLTGENELKQHIQKHTRQIARLCKKLANRSLDLSDERCDEDVPDTDASTAEEGQQNGRPELSICPDKTCDHKAFNREQDLIRHYFKHTEVNKSCHGVNIRFANKYASHKCPLDSNYKDAKKQRSHEVHGTVKAALYSALNATKKRGKESAGRQKKRKLASSFEPTKNAGNILPCISHSGQLVSETAAPESDVLMFHHTLLDGSAAAATFAPHSGQSGTSIDVAENSHLHYTHEFVSNDIAAAMLRPAPSDPPNLWDMATWPSNRGLGL